jgi:hypothetical protein
MTKNFVSSFGLFVVTGVLVGCATSPIREAMYVGNPQPLIALVKAGLLDPNERLQYNSELAYTPICALLGTVAGAASVETLLKQGADVNKPCSNFHKTLPLDIVISTAVLRGTLNNPYDRYPQYRPEHIPTYMSYAEKLIARGAMSQSGPMTMEHVKYKVLEDIELGNKFQPELVKSYQAQVDSTRSFIQGIASVAGTVVAAKVISGSSSSLTSANVARISSSLQGGVSSSNRDNSQVVQSAGSSATSNGTLSRNNQASNSDTALVMVTTARAPAANSPDLPNVIEPNPYETYPNAENWAFDKAPWKSGGSSSGALSMDRVQACQQSLASLNQTVTKEEKSGYWKVTEKSSCVCRTILTGKNWYCRAYYRSSRTDKVAPPAISR